MALLSALFGSGALDKAADIAERFLPTSEKDRYELLTEYLRATAPQALARRIIAATVTGMWAFLHLVAVTAGAIAVWRGKEWLMLQEVATNAVNGIEDYFLYIILFYFSAPHLAQASKVMVDKLGEIADRRKALQERRRP